MKNKMKLIVGLNTICLVFVIGVAFLVVENQKEFYNFEIHKEIDSFFKGRTYVQDGIYSSLNIEEGQLGSLDDLDDKYIFDGRTIDKDFFYKYNVDFVFIPDINSYEFYRAERISEDIFNIQKYVSGVLGLKNGFNDVSAMYKANFDLYISESNTFYVPNSYQQIKNFEDISNEFYYLKNWKEPYTSVTYMTYNGFVIDSTVYNQDLKLELDSKVWFCKFFKNIGIGFFFQILLNLIFYFFQRFK